MDICFLNCNFWSDQVIFWFPDMNFKIGLADNNNRSVSMNELINHTGIASIGSYTPTPSIPVEHGDSNVKKDIAKTSSKYILEKNKIVFERYGRNGKLISRVPWTANRVSAKA